jgi:magnesium chelatase family protein
MRQARALSVALVGVEGTVIEVEAAIGSGLPATIMVGLPDAALKEARQRCRAAMSVLGDGWPLAPVTINLSPATLPKAGSHYDLAIAAAVAAARGRCDPESLAGLVMFGELSLDGRVRGVRGLLPALLAARAKQVTRAVVPAVQLREASLVEGMVVYGVNDIFDLFDVLAGGPGAEAPPAAAAPAPLTSPPDLADVVGQEEARWALEVAAAGRHHLYLHGPPGVGKTLLAERLPTLLPELDDEEALEVSAIHSLCGINLDEGLVRRPPYADPHHSASLASLVGGGARIAMPGAISRAHRGVLFLDEAPEFAPKVMEALRVPLESGRIVLSRSESTAVYPANFQLVLAANPCPCGLAETPGSECRCAPMVVRRYGARISGPVLDRIDISQRLRPVKTTLLSGSALPAEPSATVAERVLAARDRQAHRLGRLGWRTNAEVPGPVLRKQLPVPDGVDLLTRAISRGQLSARGLDKCLRLAWTIADLSGAAIPQLDHVHAALAMRGGTDLERGAA